MKHWGKKYAGSFSFVGLVFATLFFCASVTPSLLPRTYIVQGLLSGLALATGYGVGVVLVAVYRFVEFRIPSKDVQRKGKQLTSVLVAIVFLVFLQRMTFWQNSIRELMDMPELQSAYPIRTAFIALLFGALLVAAARAIIRASLWVSDKLHRILPRRLAIVFGFLAVLLLLTTLGNDVFIRAMLSIADTTFLRADEIVDDGIEQPKRPMQCGSSESLVPWSTIGRRGREFLVSGPTASEIKAFSDAVDAGSSTAVMEPVRVYVGKRTKGTSSERAALALDELRRAGGFDRSVLVVATPTGTGWLDPGAIDTIEYMHGGDTAIVSTQYSYLPSWITILIDPKRSIRSATDLFEHVYAHWKTLPKNKRPKLYLHGLSLGSLGSEVSTSLYRIFEDPNQGAVWSGPPFPSSQWAGITAGRNPGSPAWLPKFDDGRLVRFTSQTNALDIGSQWGPIRNVYIQYASDPMVFFSTDLLWRRPAWLDDRGPDVSPYLTWYPVVTFLQIAFDLPMSTSVPVGYGHNYSPDDYIDAWVSVTDPPGWTAKKTKSLKLNFDPEVQ